MSPFYSIVLMLTIELALVQSQSTNIKLVDDLFATYVKDVRPISYTGQTTNVLVSPNLYSIVNVDEGAETLTFSRWFQMFWNDPFLSWDPDLYNGTKELLVDVNKIWIPDITIIEMLKLIIDKLKPSSICHACSGPEYSHFSIDAADFPYDRQNCSVSFVSWEYPADQITVNPMQSSHGYLMFYEESSEWKLLSYTYNKAIVITDNATLSFDGVRFFIAFERRPTFYVTSLVFPCFLITSLAILGIFSPSTALLDREEKVTLGLTACLAMSVVLMLVTEIMPKTEKFPLLGYYVTIEMNITGVATALAVVLMYVQSTATMGHRLPNWALKMVFLLKWKVKNKSKWDDEVESVKSDETTDTVRVDDDVSKKRSSVESKSSKSKTEKCIPNDVLQQVKKSLTLIEQELTQRSKVDKFQLRTTKFCYRMDIFLMCIFSIVNMIIFMTYFVF